MYLLAGRHLIGLYSGCFLLTHIFIDGPFIGRSDSSLNTVVLNWSSNFSIFLSGGVTSTGWGMATPLTAAATAAALIGRGKEEGMTPSVLRSYQPINIPYFNSNETKAVMYTGLSQSFTSDILTLMMPSQAILSQFAVTIAIFFLFCMGTSP